MLDGLDEVTADRYQDVVEAVFHFMDDNSPDHPTRLARLFLTCRRQNFLSLREDWVPAFSKRECSLAPLRNSEIFSYLDKIRRKFKNPNGPEEFIQAVRASGTLDLHRIPLILAMSVGLYVRKDYFEIPSSIAELYRAMIREMLDRHSFRRDHGGAALRFQVGDKYRCLREFSLHAVEEFGGFEEFDKQDLIAFARSLAPQLDAVRDAEAMVDEIIMRSGLLTDVAQDRTYIFAHRSIQEFLAAEQLRMSVDGDKFLLSRATEREWRQVIQFYVAGQEQRQIDGFLVDLARSNPELAAYCLAGAKASTRVAGAVLDALAPIDEVRVAALAAGTMSPRIPVQELAIERLRSALTRPRHVLSAGTADVDGMLPLLGSLAGTNAAQIAALVPRVIADLPDDPRLIEPLWRCLTAPGIERLPECQAIVRRLLDLVMEPNSLEELTRQDRYDRDFLTREIRRRAYPFNNSLGHRDNLVTLLAWADYLGVSPTDPNRFFQAKAVQRLYRVEADRRHTISFSLCWPARILSGVEFALAFVIAIIVLVTHPGLLLHPFGWWTLLLMFGVAVGSLMVYMALTEPFKDLPEASLRWRLLGGGGIDDDIGAFVIGNGNFFALLPAASRSAESPDSPTVVANLAMLTIPVAAIPMVEISLSSYIAVTSGALILFFLTNIHAFSSEMRYYIYKPNEYIDMYDDPRSRYWLMGVNEFLMSGWRV